MEAGYIELILTLQDIMYNDSELKYITKERNLIQSRIERICNSYTDGEKYHKTVFTHCLIIKKSTVDYLESFGYNLFRQFETSHDYERSISRRTDDKAFETYALVTFLEYALDIYCYASPPPASAVTSRRYPIVSSFTSVSTYLSLQNTSASLVDTSASSVDTSSSSVETSFAYNTDGSNYTPEISYPFSTDRGSMETPSCANESIWGSTSRLPTALVQPLSDTFWNDMPSEESSSDSFESSEVSERGGVFVKVTTLNSSNRRSITTSRGTNPVGYVHERLTSPNTNGLDNQATPYHCNDCRNCGMTGHNFTDWRNDNQTNSDSVDGCIGTEDFRLGEEMVDIEDEDSEKRDISVVDLEATHEKIKINGWKDSGNISNQTDEEVTKQMNMNKRTASSPAVSPRSSFRCSKDLKKSKVSSDTAKSNYSTSFPLDLSSGSRGLSVDDLELHESSTEKLGKVPHQEYTEIKSFELPSTSHDYTTNEKILTNNSNLKNGHEEKGSYNKNKLSFSDKSIQKECSEDQLRRNDSSFIMNNSSNNENTAIQHSNAMTIAGYQYENFDHPQRFSYENTETHTSAQHSKSFDASQSTREPCDNNGLHPSFGRQIQREYERFPVQQSFESFPIQSESFQGIRRQHPSLDQIQDETGSSREIRYPRTVEHGQDQVTDYDGTQQQCMDESPSHIEEYSPLENQTPDINERQFAVVSFSTRNRIGEPLQHPDIDREASKKEAFLPPALNVPLVWSRKCEDMQYLLSLKLSHPRRYVQEYNRIRKSSLKVLDCLRQRERSGALNQTKVLEVIAGPHYDIYPPADEDEIKRLFDDVHHEEETNLAGYLMVSLFTHRTFYSFSQAKYNNANP